MQTEVENALELRLALKRFAPDLAKETTKQMGGNASPQIASSYLLPATGKKSFQPFRD